jgi:hypothetical protein
MNQDYSTHIGFVQQPPVPDNKVWCTEQSNKTLWYLLRFSWWWLWRLLSSEMWCHDISHNFTNNVDKLATWIFYPKEWGSTIQINHQPDATILQFIILTFIYSSTCFGHFPTHHQEPLVLPSYCGDTHAVFMVKPAGPTTNTVQLSPRYEGKTRGRHCNHWAPEDGRENAQTCWAVNKHQDNKLKNCCIRLVIYLN